jgi:hypothetical protein
MHNLGWKFIPVSGTLLTVGLTVILAPHVPVRADHSPIVTVFVAVPDRGRSATKAGSRPAHTSFSW